MLSHHQLLWTESLFPPNSIKSLGILLSSSLTWSNQISFVCNKISTILYQLRLNRYLLTRDLRIKLVSTLLMLYLDYCCLVILDASYNDNSRLQRALSSAVRFIFDVGFHEHMTPYFTILRWLKVDKRRDYFLGIFLYKFLSSCSPPSLLQNFVRSEPDPLSMSTRNRNIFQLPWSRINIRPLLLDIWS